MTQLVCKIALLVFFLTGTICAQESTAASQGMPQHDDIAADRIINDLAGQKKGSGAKLAI